MTSHIMMLLLIRIGRHWEELQLSVIVPSIEINTSYLAQITTHWCTIISVC